MDKGAVEAEALSLDAKWRKICADTLGVVHKNRDSWIFHFPVVESSEIPHEAKVAYLNLISEPMDLRTVKKNVPAFNSPLEFETDMSLVFRNCMSFNKPGQDAYEMGKDVENFFLSKWQLERRREMAIALYERSVELANSVGSDVLVSSRKKSKQSPPSYDPVTRKVVELGGTSSSSGAASPKGDWREIIRIIFKNIRNNPNFAWFEIPVFKYTNIDPAVKKQYYQMIRWPMDFETIAKNLDIYPSPGEMRKDLELLVTNSVRFNPPESVVNKAALDLQKAITTAFDEKHRADLAPFRSLSNEWRNAKKISPETPPGDLLPAPEPKKPVVLRIKRGRSGDEPSADVVSRAVSAVTDVSPPMSSAGASRQTTNLGAGHAILTINRPMKEPQIPPSGQRPDWRFFANHCLEELAQIKDESTSSGNRLNWIFQKPIFKYELPVNIKRLYLLSITDLIDWSAIEAKLNSGVYDTAGPAAFEKDVELMLDNCLVFNDESQYPHKVGFVFEAHFRKYWFDQGLRKEAMKVWSNKRDPGAFASMMAVVEDMPAAEQPNWDEIRAAVMNEVVRPNQDCDSVTSGFPLNDELLYEWRVSQRYVMQQRRNEMTRQNSN